MPCPYCLGRGFTVVYEDRAQRKNPGAGPTEFQLPCPHCVGTGEYPPFPGPDPKDAA